MSDINRRTQQQLDNNGVVDYAFRCAAVIAVVRPTVYLSERAYTDRTDRNRIEPIRRAECVNGEEIERGRRVSRPGGHRRGDS